MTWQTATVIGASGLLLLVSSLVVLVRALAAGHYLGQTRSQEAKDNFSDRSLKSTVTQIESHAKNKSPTLPDDLSNYPRQLRRIGL